MLIKWSNQLKKIIFSNSFLTLGLRSFGVLFVFFISSVLTNNFSLNDVGQYEFFRIFILLIGSICLFGTEISIIYFSGKFKAENNISLLKKTYYKILKLILFTSLFIIIIFLLFFDKEKINTFFNENVYSLMKKCVFILPIYVIVVFNTETLRAIDKPILSELFRNILKYISICFGIVIILFSRNNYLTITEYYIYGFIPLFLFSQILLIIYFNKISETNYSLGLSNQEIIKTSFPMGISNIIMFLLLSVDVFLIKKNFGNTFVAYYAIGIKLITILSMVILSFSINVSTKISMLYNSNNIEELQKTCKKTAQTIFKINSIIAFVLIVFIEKILLLFGKDYTNSKIVFFILIGSQLFTSFFGTVTIYLNMTGRAKVYQKILILTLLLNITLNYILIPIYGIEGAGVALTFSVLFSNSYVAYYAYNKDKINLSIL